MAKLTSFSLVLQFRSEFSPNLMKMIFGLFSHHLHCRFAGWKASLCSSIINTEEEHGCCGSHRKQTWAPSLHI